MTSPHTTDGVELVPAAQLFTEAARSMLCRAIAKNGGREVFAVACSEAGDQVDQLDPLAFGTWDQVPAPARNVGPGHVLIHNHPSGLLEPSDADIDVASIYGQQGVGFWIVDNEVTQVRVVVQLFRPEEERLLDPAKLRNIFGPDGPVASALTGYEHRPQQLGMMEAVAKAFNQQRLLIVEAATGTGKSFAYLAPAAAWARLNKKRVMISTHTIHLQEQLMEKDLPQLRKLLGWPIPARLLKGRGNYVSRRRLELAAAERSFLPDERQTEIMQIAEWAEKTVDGTRSDLPFEVSPDVWESAASDKDDCLRARCPRFQDCFFYKSRREAAAADIVVANHSLVMADLAVRGDRTGNDGPSILPPYEYLVLDEAHHIEDVATEYFSAEVTSLALRRQFNRLAAYREGIGALPAFLKQLAQHDAIKSHAVTEQVRRSLMEAVAVRRGDLDLQIDSRFDAILDITMRYFGITEFHPREKKELRITEEVLEAPYYKHLCTLMEEIRSALSTLISPLEKALRLLDQYTDEQRKMLADHVSSLSGVLSKIAGHSANLRFFMTAPPDEFCRWLSLEWQRDTPIVRPCVAPLSMAEPLKNMLFARKKSVVLTSATLTVDRSLDFLRRRIGLVDAPDEAATDESAAVAERVDTLMLEPVFNFARQCRLGVPVDLPDPGHPGFEDAIAPVIEEAIMITGGRAFVLFTSYRQMRQLHQHLQSQLTAQGVVVMCQGEQPRSRLLKQFKSGHRCVLFATSSFWEGVDVPGQALENLILVKLPFSVPTTPIYSARAERIDKSGGSSFQELTVPMAVIRFKQGFGRLIRRADDRGIVLVLDGRVATKPYGRTFLRSLPPVPVISDTAAHVLQSLRDFYQNTLA